MILGGAGGMRLALPLPPLVLPVARPSAPSTVPAVRRRCITLVGLVLCMSLCTGGLDLLQLVAWTGMVVARCQQGTLSQSISTTFDGAHPCALCALIARQRQQQPDRLVAVMQLMQHLAKVAVVPAQLGADLPAMGTDPAGDWSYRSNMHSRDLAAPPTPPPDA